MAHRQKGSDQRLDQLTRAGEDRARKESTGRLGSAEGLVDGPKNEGPARELLLQRE
jgi:hypothetical protein